MENILIKYKKRNIRLEVKKTGIFSKGLGLMFKTRNAKNLLFDFKRDVNTSITSYFVFFPFLILWLNERNEVLEKKIVKPFVFNLGPSQSFRKFVEIPLNERNSEITGFFVGKGKV